MYLKLFCARIVNKRNVKTGTGYEYKTVLSERLRKCVYFFNLQNISGGLISICLACEKIPMYATNLLPWIFKYISEIL